MMNKVELLIELDTLIVKAKSELSKEDYEKFIIKLNEVSLALMQNL